MKTDYEKEMNVLDVLADLATLQLTLNEIDKKLKKVEKMLRGIDNEDKSND